MWNYGVVSVNFHLFSKRTSHLAATGKSWSSTILKLALIVCGENNISMV